MTGSRAAGMRFLGGSVNRSDPPELVEGLAVVCPSAIAVGAGWRLGGRGLRSATA